jgi:hypothetical protein
MKDGVNCAAIVAQKSKPMQSLNNTLIGAGGEITDAEGNVWTVTTGGQVAVNGLVDTTTGNVSHLAYANGLVWQENTADLWWSKTSPTSDWSPTYGTSTVPVPLDSSPSGSVIGASAEGPIASFTDASANVWSIVNGQVAVNGVIDPATANVIELAYENGKIWQENSQGLWWSKSAPADSWDPPYGTSTNPITGTFWVENTSGNFAVINVGELTASPDGGAGTPPLSLTEIITPGVRADGTVITVSTETATLVVNGNSSLTNGATLNLIGAYRTPSEISGPIENNGVMTVRNSIVEFGALSGNGSINASNGSTLDIQSSGTGDTISLQSSQLFIGGQGGPPGGPGVPGGMSFLASIAMDKTSTITLDATQATSEVLKRAGGSISEVFLYNGTTEVADLKISGVTKLYATETASGSVMLGTVPSNSDIPIVKHVT